MWERFTTPRLDGRVMADRSSLDRFELLFISPTRIRLRIKNTFWVSLFFTSVILSFIFFSLFCVCISTSVPIFLFSSFLSSSSCCQALYNFLSRFFMFVSVPLYQPFFFNFLLPSFSFTVGLYPCRFLCLVFYLYMYFCADIFHSSCLSISLCSCNVMCCVFVLYL